MAAARFEVPTGDPDITLNAGGRSVRLTNLNKLFFPETGLTKGGLIQYYADVAPALLPGPGGRCSRLPSPAVRPR